MISSLKLSSEAYQRVSQLTVSQQRRNLGSKERLTVAALTAPMEKRRLTKVGIEGAGILMVMYEMRRAPVEIRCSVCGRGSTSR